MIDGKYFMIQCKKLINEKKYILTFWIVMILVLFHFVLNVIHSQGKDVLDMNSRAVIGLLSELNLSTEGKYFLQFIPFLLVLPAAFSLADDLECGEYTYIRFRLSASKYILTKVIAVFCVTFLVFEIPLILEIVLNMISFPGRSSALFMGWSYYREETLDILKAQSLYRMLATHPDLHVLLMSIKFSFLCSVFAVFTLACSTLKAKLKVFLFLPVYLVLYLLEFADRVFGLSFSTDYNNYFAYNNAGFILNWKALWILVTVLIFVSGLLFFRYTQKDCL